ncbi:hypothetical protein [Micromonospora sp. SH-82]|uniref:hypothetical protein n=1 Tax=Micromonospora sp. SH-82 TaxID=3132938 RepID=UPI003EC029C2
MAAQDDPAEWAALQVALHRHIGDPSTSNRPLPHYVVVEPGRWVDPNCAVESILRDGRFPSSCPVLARILIKDHLQRNYFDRNGVARDPRASTIVPDPLGRTSSSRLNSWMLLHEYLLRRFDDPANWSTPLPAVVAVTPSVQIRTETMIQHAVVAGGFPANCPVDTQQLIRSYLRMGIIDVGPLRGHPGHGRLLWPELHVSPSQVSDLGSPFGQTPGPASPPSATRPGTPHQWPGPPGPQHPHHSR